MFQSDVVLPSLLIRLRTPLGLIGSIHRSRVGPVVTGGLSFALFRRNSYCQSPDVSHIVVDGMDWSSDCSSDCVAQVSSLGDL